MMSYPPDCIHVYACELRPGDLLVQASEPRLALSTSRLNSCEVDITWLRGTEILYICYLDDTQLYVLRHPHA